MQLKITPAAVTELRAGGVNADTYLRLAVVPGGCAGMSYNMFVDDALNEGDQLVYQAEDIRVITDPDSARYIDGLTIDFSDDLVESGFRLTNPNAHNSCGCGSSFGCG